MAEVLPEPEVSTGRTGHAPWVRVSHWIVRIVVKDEFDDGGERGNIQNGWAWYTGI